jgi:hypothetical protein
MRSLIRYVAVAVVGVAALALSANAQIRIEPVTPRFEPIPQATPLPKIETYTAPIAVNPPPPPPLAPLREEPECKLHKEHNEDTGRDEWRC